MTIRSMIYDDTENGIYMMIRNMILMRYRVRYMIYGV